MLGLALTVAGLQLPSIAEAEMPKNGATYRAGVTIELPCDQPTRLPDVHASDSTLYRADPAWKQNRVYPASATAFNPPKWKPTTVVATRSFLNATPAGPCANSTIEADETTDNAPVVLWTPGYYTVRWFVIDEHLIPIPAGKLPPDVKTCKDDAIRAPYISDISEDTGIPFIVVKHCRHFKTISFTVIGEPGTACNAATGFVGPTYFNQYASGPQYRLPTDQYGQRGGNACGASAVAMALHLRGEPKPDITAIYNSVMAHKPQDGIQNALDGEKTLSTLKSLGYKHARVVEFTAPTDDVAPDNEQVQELLDGHEGPVILSTTFGANPWSVRGGGHIILVEGRKPARGAGPSRGDYIVRDPAGDFFASDAANHYGRRVCGMEVDYPARWIGAMTVTNSQKAGWIGKYAIVLGPRTVKPHLVIAVGARAALGPTEVLFTLENDGSDAWIETAGHTKAGFIDGAQADNLDGVGVAALPTFPSDPRTSASPPPAAAPERTLLLDTPGPGLRLRVRGHGHTHETIEMLVYQRGKIVQRKSLHLTLTKNAETVLRIPSFGGVTPTTKPKLTISAKPDGQGV